MIVGHAELAQPRAEGDAALAAADDDDVGLGLVAELARLALALLGPGLALAIGPVLGAARAAGALVLLVALELVQGGQQRPGPGVVAVALEPELPAPAPDRGLELDPRLGDAVRGGRLLAFGDRPVARTDLGQLRLEHRGDLGPALAGLEVPGEGDEVAPVGVLAEQLRGRLRVTGAQRAVEGREPGLDGRAGRCRFHRCRHGVLPRSARGDAGRHRQSIALRRSRPGTSHCTPGPRGKTVRSGRTPARSRTPGHGGTIGVWRPTRPGTASG